MRRGVWLIVFAVVLAVSSAPALAQQTPPPAKSHAVVTGTLIGLAAGLAGGIGFLGGSDCHYGSDSPGAMVACGAITGGIIAGGIVGGHLIGHRIANRAAKPPRAARSRILWRPSETVPLASLGVHLRLPRMSSEQTTSAAVASHEHR